MVGRQAIVGQEGDYLATKFSETANISYCAQGAHHLLKRYNPYRR
jgi:hypothetical protein